MGPRGRGRALGAIGRPRTRPGASWLLGLRPWAIPMRASQVVADAAPGDSPRDELPPCMPVPPGPADWARDECSWLIG